MDANSTNPSKKQAGISMVELIPILLVFAILFNFTLGFFGVVQSGIKNSIAARNYAFETFRNRSQLNRLRDALGSNQTVTYNLWQMRFHTVIAEEMPADNQFYVTSRPIRFTDLHQGAANESPWPDHRRVSEITDPGSAKAVYTEKKGIDWVWLRAVYGICLSARCQP